MFEFKIDKGVPLPTRIRINKNGPLRYPLDKIKVGESFLTEEPYSPATMNRVRARINHIAKRAKLRGRFAVSRDPNGNNIRTWRIE